MLIACATPAHAAITVNGDLSDWGATGTSIKINGGGALALGVANNTSGAYSTFIDNTVTVRFHSEDSSDSAGDSGFVGPNYGGQNYDGEFLGVSIHNGYLYIAIVSGQRPDNGKARFGPGDIRIITQSNSGTTTYGLEVGGGVGNSSTQAPAINEGALGTTYNLNSNGFTNTTTPLLTTHTSQTAGSLFRNPGWLNDPIPPPGPTQLQFDGSVGEFVTLADYHFTRDALLKPDNSPSQHSIIELAIPYTTSVFSAANERLTQVEWRPSCGNDELIVAYSDSTGPSPVVPEPASMIVWGLIIGLGLTRQRQNLISWLRRRSS
jgi:hypothetical protein